MSSVNILELKELKEKLHRIKLMSDGDIIDFINFKKNNQIYIIVGIISVLCSIIPLIILKVNKVYSKQTGGSIPIILYSAKFIVIFSFIFIIIGLLSLKKISIYCFGCSKGSWWYKCMKNTGKGSTQCENIQTAHDTIVLLTNNVYDILYKTANLAKTIEQTITLVGERISNFSGTIQSSLVIPNFDIPKITNFPEIQCNFKVPIINTNIDICSPLQSTVHNILEQVNNSLRIMDILVDNIRTGLQSIIDFIITILGEIVSNFLNVFDSITDPIEASIQMIIVLKEHIINIFDIISDIGIINVILYNFLLFINNLSNIIVFNNIPNDFTINSTSNSKIGLMLSIITILFIIFLIFPIIGGCYLGLKAIYNILTFPIMIVQNIIMSFSG